MTKPNEALRKTLERLYADWFRTCGTNEEPTSLLHYIATHGPAHGIGVVSDEARKAHENLAKVRNFVFATASEKLDAYWHACGHILALGPQPSQPVALETPAQKAAGWEYMTMYNGTPLTDRALCSLGAQGWEHYESWMAAGDFLYRFKRPIPQEPMP